jgi:23S rRNA (cytosine1962-C5)-methyltransferase
MDRDKVFPAFEPARIVHLDDDLVVIDKPVGVPAQAADPELPDDVVTRLKSFLGAPYLGVHQRLDRETSGLMLFTRRREANARIAAAFEGRRVKKTYVACVEGWSRRGRSTLRDRLAPGEDGKMRVAARGDLAVTHVRFLDRRGARSLLELELETGRTHQARVQLAHAGAPIAGDTLYGGPRGPRLMLHASGLALAGSSYASPPPPEFAEYLARGDLGAGIYEVPGALARALAWAKERRWGLARSASGPRATTAFRLAHEGGDGLPGLALDVYADWLVAQFHTEQRPGEPVLDALDRLGFDGVYLKMRPKQSNLLVDTRREDLAPRLPVRGRQAPDEIEVLEDGLPFQVRLGDGLSTGLFLDQRKNRRRVRELAPGARVLNLFAYTCGFTLAAAAGGAANTVSIDVSAAALERGRANLERARLLSPAHAFVADDVFGWLARARTKGAFDLVVLDPPSYSSTKRRRFVASDDYVELAAAALALLAPGGRLLACTNHRGISRSRFRKMLFDAARRAGREVRQAKDLPASSDFPPEPGTEPHMKSVLVTTT